MSTEWDGAWITPEGEMIRLEDEAGYEHVLEKHFPDLARKWEKEWEPKGLDYSEEAIEYAKNRGWIQLHARNTSDVLTVWTNRVPQHAAVNKLRLVIENGGFSKLYVEGPNQDRPTLAENSEELIQALLGR